MPRFLNADYLNEALQRHKATLNRYLLTLPHHLEQVGNYIHQGKLPDSTYRKPWLRSTVRSFDIDLYLNKENELADLRDCANPSGRLEFESFQGVIGEATRFFDADVIFVPSSNPNSTASFGPEDDTHGPSDMEDCHIGYLEKFTKQNLPSCVCDSEYFVEDLQSFNYFSEYLLEVPRISQLLKKLKPKIVSDPLVDTDGKTITHHSIFSNDLSFCSSNDNRPSVCDFEESYHIQEINRPDCFSLEEVLDMPTQLYIGQNFTVSVKELKAQHTEELQMLTDSGRYNDNSIGPFQTSTLECIELSRQETEPTFVTINESESSPTMCLEPLTLLESPAVDAPFMLCRDWVYEQPWTQLTPFIIDP